MMLEQTLSSLSFVALASRFRSTSVLLLTTLLLVILCLLASSPVMAGSVYLNGANIDGVKNQVFKGCDVTIDKFGNVLISAKGFKAVGGNAAPPGPAGPPPVVAGKTPTQHYFLVTEKAQPGTAMFNIDLFINNKFVRKLLDVEGHIVMELTKHFKTGPNKIRLIAKRRDLNGVAETTSANNYFRLVVGRGDMGGRQVMIAEKLLDYKRNAAEKKNFNEEFTVSIK